MQQRDLGVVLYQREPPIARIVLNWPEKANAQSEAMVRQVAQAPLSTLMATKSLLVRAWEQMGMRQHLQLSADVMSVTEKTSDAMALRQRMVERGAMPRQMTGGDSTEGT